MDDDPWARSIKISSDKCIKQIKTHTDPTSGEFSYTAFSFPISAYWDKKLQKPTFKAVLRKCSENLTDKFFLYVKTASSTVRSTGSDLVTFFLTPNDFPDQTAIISGFNGHITFSFGSMRWEYVCVPEDWEITLEVSEAEPLPPRLLYFVSNLHSHKSGGLHALRPLPEIFTKNTIVSIYGYKNERFGVAPDMFCYFKGTSKLGSSSPIPIVNGEGKQIVVMGPQDEIEFFFTKTKISPGCLEGKEPSPLMIFQEEFNLVFEFEHVLSSEEDELEALKKENAELKARVRMLEMRAECVAPGSSWETAGASSNYAILTRIERLDRDVKKAFIDLTKSLVARS